MIDPQAEEPLYQSALPNQTDAAAFRRWSDDAPLVLSDEAQAHEFRSGEKIVVEAFHGAARPDRIGARFKKTRATSGPMAFFSSDPAVSSGYATGKADTSIGDEAWDYPQWFKTKLPGDRSPTGIVRAWYRLTPLQKARIAELAPRVWMQEDAIEIAPEGHANGVGNYDWELGKTRKSLDRQGNPLQALVEGWLSGGVLFGQEERFIDVLKLAGWPAEMPIDFDSPNASYPFVYKVFVKMGKPLVTSDVPANVVAALDAAAKRDRSRANPGGDTWAKNARTLREWVQAFHGDQNEYVWASIPDKVTEVFKSFGYDGIVDTGGKGGGPQHKVYIPFDDTQVKSAIGNRGTFDDSTNILHQSTPILDAVQYEHAFSTAESRLVQGLSEAGLVEQRAGRVVRQESTEPSLYTAGRVRPAPYSDPASPRQIDAEEARLIARAKDEGFFWGADKLPGLLAALGPKRGGGNEHDVYLVGDSPTKVVVRSTVKDSYGFAFRSPAQYLRRIADYNRIFPDLQMRVIGVSRSPVLGKFSDDHGNGIVWTAQPFVEGEEFASEEELRQAMEASGWEHLGDLEYRHKDSGVVIDDAHTGNVLHRDGELFPIDVIVKHIPGGCPDFCV